MSSFTAQFALAFTVSHKYQIECGKNNVLDKTFIRLRKKIQFNYSTIKEGEEREKDLNELIQMVVVCLL